MTDHNLPAVQAETTPAYAAIGFGGASGFDIAPQSLGEVVGFAKLMASAKHAIPAHLRDNAGACMAVTIQALGWQMSPFQVAQKSYKVGDTIAYEAQLIAAVVNARAGFKNRPLVEYIGEGPTRQCRVTFTFKNGDVRDYLSPKFADITTKNSPLWKSDPDQQFSYFSLRSAARRHCPEVILGVYDPDELEHSEPLATSVERRQPVSMRAKLADGTKSPGFDPNHVETETGGTPSAASEVIQGQTTEPHDPVTGEVIESGEAEKPDNDPPEPRSEAEQKAQLAAAMASLDKPKPEPSPAEVVEAQPDPIPDPAEASQEATIDSADDLIRQNAYDDGFAGEPVDAVLVMCEDEREEAIARGAHAEGHAARIAKEAAEHAAREIQGQADADQAANDALDIGGAAPAGTKYLLGTEEPGADGKINLYLDGKVFSRVPSEPALAKHPRYDGHPQPADPALASQGGGTGLPDKSEPEAVPTTVMKPNGLYESFAAKESWLQIKPLLTILYGSDDFKALSPDDQAATRAHLFGAVLEMKDRTKDPVDWATDAACFGLWMDWMAAGTDSPSDKVAAIQGTFDTIKDGKFWKERLKDEQRNVLENRVLGVLAKIKGS